MKIRKIKIVGLGGIGCWLVEPLCRYLSHTGDNIEVTLIDGDTYEDKNRSRQSFEKLDNKATAKAEEMTKKLPKVFFRGKADYVTPDNVISLIRENDIVFLCVDNHATRKCVSERCSELDNVLLISGGNDFTDGNVIYYNRENGEDVTKSPTALYDKIANPKDENPGEKETTTAGCEELTEDNPQLLFTNLAIASSMCNVYYAHEQGKAKFEQVYLDIVRQRMRPSPEQF